MEKYELGLNKKSFSLYFNGGEIWCEHLDSLYEHTDLMKEKFRQDLLQISVPSTSGFIAVNLDETKVSQEEVKEIIDSLVGLDKSLRKVVFVGLNSKNKRYVKKRSNDTPFRMTCIDDFQEAKEWLL